MSNEFTLNAKLRADQGKGASRRLRRLENLLPAVIYGAGKTPVSITLELRELTKALTNEAFYSHILTLNVEGTEQQVILKDLQRHPAKEFAMHADFLRVDANHKLTTHVPLHFLNEEECPGVKSGGSVTHNAIELEVKCLPADLPEFIEVDLANSELGDSIHLSDLTIPAGVELVQLAHGHDVAVAAVQQTRGAKDAEAEEEVATEEGASEE